MSIDDATPSDWDALRKEHPAVVREYVEYFMEDDNKKVTQDQVDNVNSPSHYNYGKVECIEAIEESMTQESFKGYLKGNTLKYLWRYERKGKSLEDLKKAEWYLKKLIASNAPSTAEDA
jgi:hypothetical protein